MRAVLRALFKPGQLQISSKSVNSGSSLREVASYPQVLTERDSSGMNFHVNLLDDCYVVTKTFFLIEGYSLLR